MSGLDSSQEITDEVTKHASKYDVHSRPEDDLEPSEDDADATAADGVPQEPGTP